MKKLPPGTIIILLEKKFGLKVKKHVKTYSVKCPFHDDNKASALVFPEVNVFTCLVCGQKLKEKWAKISGKSLKPSNTRYHYIPAKAVAMLEGINKKALTEEEWKLFLKEIQSGNIKQETYENQNFKETKKDNDINPEEIWKLCKEHICTNSLKYLKSRNINGNILFKKNLIRFLNKEVAAKYKILYYYYKNDYKILIPLYDYNGKNIVNIQFRKISKNNKLPKAKFLPGGKVTDFGIEDLKQNSLATFLVEGSTDYLSLKSLGYKNVIGLTNINSTFSTPEKINLLKKLPKFIFMFYDNDEPGIEFMKQIKNQIKNLDNSKIFIPLNLLSKTKKIKDVNDFIIATENPKNKINQSIKKLISLAINNKEIKDRIINNLDSLI